MKTAETSKTRDLGIETSKSEGVRKAAARLIPGGACQPEAAARADGPADRVAAVPPVIAKARGATLTDVDGNEYIDYVCANGALILGHADERIVAAVDKAASKGWGFPSLTETSVRLAELIASRFSTIDMVRLVNSQAEAAVGAIQIARTHTQRERIAVIEPGADGLFL